MFLDLYFHDFYVNLNLDLGTTRYPLINDSAISVTSANWSFGAKT